MICQRCGCDVDELVRPGTGALHCGKCDNSDDKDAEIARLNKQIQWIYGKQLLPTETALAAERAAREKLLQEAQCHAQEARAANATIAEIYQLCTGATGEPGNWHGAEPVRQLLTSLRAELEAAKRALTVCVNLLEIWSKWTPDYCSAHTNFEGLPEIIEARAAIAGKEK